MEWWRSVVFRSQTWNQSGDLSLRRKETTIWKERNLSLAWISGPTICIEKMNIELHHRYPSFDPHNSEYLVLRCSWSPFQCWSFKLVDLLEIQIETTMNWTWNERKSRQLKNRENRIAKIEDYPYCNATGPLSATLEYPCSFSVNDN